MRRLALVCLVTKEIHLRLVISAQLKHQLIRARPRLVDHIVYVALLVVTLYAHVKSNISVHRLSVARNAWLAVNVCRTKHASIRNVLIPVLERVGTVLNVQ